MKWRCHRGSGDQTREETSEVRRAMSTDAKFDTERASAVPLGLNVHNARLTQA